MKQLLNSLLLVLAVNSVQAEGILDDTVFGMSIINQNVSSTINISGNAANVDDSGTGFGIYLDKYYKRTYRFNSTLSYVGYDLFDLAELSLSADYLVPLNQKISLFVGLSVGGGMQKYSDSGMSEASFGFMYGVEIGGIAYMNRNLMMELGYRQKNTSIETGVTSSSNSLATLDEIDELYLSFIVMF